jgi:hypothetical protein
MSQEPPQQPEQQPERHKPGPREKLHSLYPLTFEQAIARALRYKPKKKTARPDGRKQKKKH